MRLKVSKLEHSIVDSKFYYSHALSDPAEQRVMLAVCLRVSRDCFPLDSAHVELLKAATINSLLAAIAAVENET